MKPGRNVGKSSRDDTNHNILKNYSNNSMMNNNNLSNNPSIQNDSDISNYLFTKLIQKNYNPYTEIGDFDSIDLNELIIISQFIHFHSTLWNLS